MKKVFIFLGPPGCGKGTQTEKLSRKLNLPHIDTGGLLRKHIQEGTPLGLEGKKFIDKGELVPLWVVESVIKDRLSAFDCKKGYILDGYPRSLEQAEALENIQKELNYGTQNIAIYFDIPTDVLVERLINRRSCSKCGAIYNLLSSKPKLDNICDICGNELIQRADDNKETALLRFKTYDDVTKPLLKYFKDLNILQEINAQGTISEVWEQIKDIIN